MLKGRTDPTPLISQSLARPLSHDGYTHAQAPVAFRFQHTNAVDVSRHLNLAPSLACPIGPVLWSPMLLVTPSKPDVVYEHSLQWNVHERASTNRHQTCASSYCRNCGFDPSSAQEADREQGTDERGHAFAGTDDADCEEEAKVSALLQLAKQV